MLLDVIFEICGVLIVNSEVQGGAVLMSWLHGSHGWMINPNPW